MFIPNNMETMKGISVIICCYNSENRIAETISYVANQKNTEGIPWEVIVVNNASTDNTDKVAKKEWERYKTNVNFKIVDQPILGLSSAKMKGIEEAKYEYLLFCDDDNWLNENYISLAYEIMEDNAEIGVLGGKSEGEYEGTPPEWFTRRKAHFAIGEQSPESGDLTESRGWVWGAASIYRKQSLDTINNLKIETVLTGRKGNKMTTGEDVELCFMIRELGYKIWYDDRLLAKHYMPSSRYSFKKFNKLHIANGIAYYLIYDVYQQKINIDYQYINKLFRTIFSLFLRNILKRNEEEIFNLKFKIGIIKGYYGYKDLHAVSLNNKNILQQSLRKE